MSAMGSPPVSSMRSWTNDLLKELVDGIQALGYHRFMDMREQTLWVKTKDRIILTGKPVLLTSRSTTSYLVGGLLRPERRADQARGIGAAVKGSGLACRRTRTRAVSTAPNRRNSGRDRSPSSIRWGGPCSLSIKGQRRRRDLAPGQAAHHVELPARAGQHTTIRLRLRQSSAASTSLSTPCSWESPSTPESGSPCSGHNLLIVPLTFVDSLGTGRVRRDHEVRAGRRVPDYRRQERSCRRAGNQIRRHPIEGEQRVRDRFFPEERIPCLARSGLVTKFEAGDVDQVFCVDEATEAPLVVGIKLGGAYPVLLKPGSTPSLRSAPASTRTC